jgi:hypothetical protein
MDRVAVQALRAARRAGEPEFITSPTRVTETGLVIPAIRACTDENRWVLQESWTHETPAFRLTLPGGWDSDLASVPGPLRRWINAFEMGITGPLVHDFIYNHGGELPEGSASPPRKFTRREADALLVRLMKLERVGAWRRLLAWVCARALGWSHWGVRGSRLPLPG